MTGYKEDLAYIHDAGYTEFAKKAAPALLSMLRRNGHNGGLVIDLGCGTGVWARDLVQTGYKVLGIDISPAMIQLARKRVPQARFIVGSLLKVPLPHCIAVTAIGECLNYCFDPGNTKTSLTALFGRVYEALTPGGLFVFDIAVPSAVRASMHRKGYWDGKDWLVCVETTEDKRHRLLTRRITGFRKLGNSYRRSDETHRLRLYDTGALARELERLGFKVRLLSGYGTARLPTAHAAFVARKPR